MSCARPASDDQCRLRTERSREASGARLCSVFIGTRIRRTPFVVRLVARASGEAHGGSLTRRQEGAWLRVGELPSAMGLRAGLVLLPWLTLTSAGEVHPRAGVQGLGELLVQRDRIMHFRPACHPRGRPPTARPITGQKCVGYGAYFGLARQPRKDTVCIVDGTLVPTPDRGFAASSENYRYSTSLHVIIDASSRLVVAVGLPLPGSPNNGPAFTKLASPHTPFVGNHLAVIVRNHRFAFPRHGAQRALQDARPVIGWLHSLT